MSESGTPSTPVLEPDRTTFETWKDDVGRVWNAVTGKRVVWAFGQPVRVTFYPRLALMARILTLSLLFVLVWKVWEIAHDVRELVSLEVLK